MSWAEELFWPCWLVAVQRYTPWSATPTPWMTRDSSPPIWELLIRSVSARLWPLWSHSTPVKGSPSNEQLNSAMSPLCTWTSLISISSLGLGESLISKLLVSSEPTLSIWISTVLQDMEELSETISVNSTLWVVCPTDRELKLSVRASSLWLSFDSVLDTLAKAFSSGQQERVEELGQHIILATSSGYLCCLPRVERRGSVMISEGVDSGWFPKSIMQTWLEPKCKIKNNYGLCQCSSVTNPESFPKFSSVLTMLHSSEIKIHVSEKDVLTVHEGREDSHASCKRNCTIITWAYSEEVRNNPGLTETTVSLTGTSSKWKCERLPGGWAPICYKPAAGCTKVDKFKERGWSLNLNLVFTESRRKIKQTKESLKSLSFLWIWCFDKRGWQTKHGSWIIACQQPCWVSLLSETVRIRWEDEYPVWRTEMKLFPLLIVNHKDSLKVEFFFFDSANLACFPTCSVFVLS